MSSKDLSLSSQESWHLRQAFFLERGDAPHQRHPRLYQNKLKNVF